jgi:septal ring factor EnvC (AmiA/AmiB activator)
MTPEDQPLTKRDLREALDHAVEVIADEFTGLRNEMNRRFDRVDQRFDSLDRRVERIEFQTIGMSKSLTDAERLDSATAAALAAQQKAIDDLYAQLAALKRRIPPLPSQQ